VSEIKQKFKVRLKAWPSLRVRCSGEAPKPAREARVLPGTGIHSLHISVRAFAIFFDEAIDARGDNRQRYRVELERLRG